MSLLLLNPVSEHLNNFVTHSLNSYPAGLDVTGLEDEEGIPASSVVSPLTALENVYAVTKTFFGKRGLRSDNESADFLSQLLKVFQHQTEVDVPAPEVSAFLVESHRAEEHVLISMQL